FPYLGEHRRLLIMFDAAKAAFMSGYLAAKQSAQKQLGDMYKESDYPTPDELDSRIGCELEVMPLPDAKDFRVALGEADEAASARRSKPTSTPTLRRRCARYGSAYTMRCRRWRRAWSCTSPATARASRPNIRFGTRWSATFAISSSCC